ncbi:DUF2268 domain-containing protein [Bacillus sp. OxB-1]|uniref:DUF2268 domain-containing protein n=1 Tax=Bacillus sp. (strain OxB-1) TaxID=98228 RepID=UPI0005971E95|nr:DUF2268 domain-containing putative Zn-dependent protease [Bacillus sp. OxB-1]
MGVVNTNDWLTESDGNPIDLCKKLSSFFPDASVSDIYHHLLTFGMYPSAEEGRKMSEKLEENNVWTIAQHEFEQLQQLWQGPDVPIFIFPSDSDNELLMREFNGKSGLAFQDKLFLFIAPHNTESEILALLTHEYNHVCRLTKYPKREEEYVLLDTIIMEGLAEMAVQERLGEGANPAWLSLYADEVLEKLWIELVYPEKDQAKMTATHQEVLYGLGSYPKMAGYCVGYYLVRTFLNGKALHTADLFTYSSSRIAQLPT